MKSASVGRIRIKMHLKRVLVLFIGFGVLMTLYSMLYLTRSENFHKLVTLTESVIRQTGKHFNSVGYTLLPHSKVLDAYFKTRKSFALSGLGKYLFLNEDPPEMKNKIFKILIWKDGPFLERRHMRSFTSEKHDPFDPSICSVSNCMLTYETSDLKDADAVAFLLHRLKAGDMPKEPERPAHQRWVYITDESPRHTFLFGSNNNTWRNYSGVFNWSMTYKLESDVPVPYGRTVPLPTEIILPGYNLGPEIMSLVPNNEIKQREVLVSAMISNCGKNNKRLEYVKELEKYLTVHLYGGCGTEFKNACPGHFGSDCPAINKYLFHLSFENTNCDQYFTEKLFWNAYGKGAVPVILGPKTNCSRHTLPPESFINTWDYARPVDLARYILFLNATWSDDFFKYHDWRRHFSVLNEHGYFGSTSYHYCRLCEALNYNDEQPKVIDDLSDFLDPDKNCYQIGDWEVDVEQQ